MSDDFDGPDKLGWPQSSGMPSLFDEATREARELGERLGARSIQSVIKEMKERLKAPWPWPRVIIFLGAISSCDICCSIGRSACDASAAQAC